MRTVAPMCTPSTMACRPASRLPTTRPAGNRRSRNSPRSSRRANTPAAVTDPLLAAEALEPLIRATVDEAEAARRFPSSVIAAMADAHIFRLLVPRAAGGDEVDPITMLNVIEAVSRVDGSAGWVTMIG